MQMNSTFATGEAVLRVPLPMWVALESLQMFKNPCAKGRVTLTRPSVYRVHLGGSYTTDTALATGSGVASEGEVGTSNVAAALG